VVNELEIIEEEKKEEFEREKMRRESGLL